MKAVYIYLDNTRSAGVLHKVKAKIRLLNEGGLQTTGLFLNRSITVPAREGDIIYAPFKPQPLPGFYNKRFVRNYKWYFSANSNQKQLYGALESELGKLRFDLVICRYPLANKHLLRFITRNKVKIVFEHNTKEPDELAIEAGAGGLAGYAYRNELKYGPKVLRLAAGIIGVTEEIRQYELHRCGNEKKPSVTITNGTDFSAVVPRSVPVFDGTILNLLFLCGSDVSWHGEDRLIRGMHVYKGNTEIHLFLVGNVPDSSKKLVRDLGLESSVTFAETVHGAGLDAYYNTCHLGIGTLALHRKGLKEAVSLKVRDYIAHGLPVVLAYPDSDLENVPALKPFYLRFESAETPIDMETVVRFAQQVSAIKGMERIMREAAAPVMDTRVKVNQLREFLQTIS